MVDVGQTPDSIQATYISCRNLREYSQIFLISISEIYFSTNFQPIAALLRLVLFHIALFAVRFAKSKSLIHQYHSIICVKSLHNDASVVTPLGRYGSGDPTLTRVKLHETSPNFANKNRAKRSK